MEHADPPAAPAAPARARKPKRVRESGKPKGLISCFLFFAAKHRERVKAESGEISNAEVSKKLGAEWQAATEQEKAEFLLLAEEDKIRYKQEMEGFVEGKRKRAKEEADKAEADKIRAAQERQAREEAAAASGQARQNEDGSFSVNVSSDLCSCPVCLGVQEKYVSCQEGHIVCIDCSLALRQNKCPVCREPMTRQRNRAIEAVARELPRDCPYPLCDHVAPNLDAMVRHRVECECNPARDFVCTTCNKRFRTRGALLDHLHDQSAEAVYCGSVNTTGDLTAQLQWTHRGRTLDALRRFFSRSTSNGYFSTLLTDGDVVVLFRIYMLGDQEERNGGQRGLLMAMKQVCKSSLTSVPPITPAKVQITMKGEANGDELTAVFSEIADWDANWNDVKNYPSTIFIPEDKIVARGNLTVQCALLPR